MDRMVANWPSALADPALAAQREQEFRVVYAEVGEERFTEGVTKCIRNHRDPETGRSFFPSVAEFEAYVPGKKALFGDYCDLCRDSSGIVIIKRQHPWKPELQEVAAKCKHGRTA